MPRTAIPPFDRLLAKCEWRGDCLIWTGGVVGTKSTYGTFRHTTRVTDTKAYVHRWIYENTIGPIPAGYEIDHIKARGCKSTLCVNPEHLEPVTQQENNRRNRLTECKRGHDMTDPRNVTFDQQGRRRGCAACRRLHASKGGQ